MAESNETMKAAAKTGKFSSTGGLDAIIFGTILLVFLLCPLFFTGLVAQGIGFEKMVLFYFLVLLGVVAWVTKGVIVGELSLKRTPLDIPILATIIVFAVSTALSVSVKDSLLGAYGASAKGLAAVVVFALFYYLVVNNLTASRVKSLFWAFALSSGLVILVSLLQLMEVYILPWELSKTRAFNPIGTLSGLTMYVMSILPILVVGATQAGEIMPKAGKAAVMGLKALLGLFILGGMAVLLLLNGFTFWPVGVVGAVIVLMFFLSKIIKVTNNNLIIPLAAFLAMIILLVLGNFNIVDLGLSAEVSLSRGASWDIAREAVKQSPIFGSGPGTFAYNFSQFKSPQFNDSLLWNVRFDSASGTLFELLATVGALGALAALVVALIALSVSFLSLVKAQDKETSSIMLGLFASFVSVLLFSALFALNNSMILMLILIATFTVAASLAMYPERFRELKLSFRASPKYALALAAVFLCVSAGVVVLFTMGLKMYLADFYARRAVAAPTAEGKIAELSRSVALTPYRDVYFLSLANNYMGLANQTAMAGGDQAAVGSQLNQAIENGRRAVQIAPNSAASNEALALIYENASFYTRGALEWAEQHYNKVAELEPQSPTPALRVALINMARANAETDPEEKKFYVNEAIKKYDEAIAKKNDLAAAYYGKSIAYEKIGNLGEAIEQLKRANLVAANNLDYRFELGRMLFNRGVTDPKIAQNAPEAIAEAEIDPEASTSPESLSASSGAAGTQSSKNQDLRDAEQLFLSIVAANRNHANALYSLGVLYQKTGERDNAKAAVDQLLNVLQDEPTKEAVRKQFEGIL